MSARHSVFEPGPECFRCPVRLFKRRQVGGAGHDEKLGTRDKRVHESMALWRA